jgi:hypothetical protein
MSDAMANREAGMTTEYDATREAIEQRLRQQFEQGLERQIGDQLDRERDAAVEALIEEWKERRGEELEGLENELEKIAA